MRNCIVIIIMFTLGVAQKISVYMNGSDWALILDFNYALFTSR